MRVRRVERNQENLEKITYMATATSRTTVILYNNQRQVKLKEEQLNVKNIGQIFGLSGHYLFNIGPRWNHRNS